MTGIEEIRKRQESDAALIDSLNRYIEALEGRAAMQEELISDLKKQLKELLAKPKYKSKLSRQKRRTR